MLLLLMGGGVNAGPEELPLTTPARDYTLTAEARDFTLEAAARDYTLTAEDRP